MYNQQQQQEFDVLDMLTVLNFCMNLYQAMLSQKRFNRDTTEFDYEKTKDVKNKDTELLTKILETLNRIEGKLSAE